MDISLTGSDLVKIACVAVAGVGGIVAIALGQSQIGVPLLTLVLGTGFGKFLG